MAWIGVDFDGTLAVDGTEEPVPLMVARIQKWLHAGIEVRIVTARVSKHGQNAKEVEEQKRIIAAWTKKHIGVPLYATAQKDYAMIELWDDRAVTVQKDTGIALAAPSRGFYGDK